MTEKTIRWPEWTTAEYARGVRDSCNMEADRAREHKGTASTLWIGGLLIMAVTIWNPGSISTSIQLITAAVCVLCILGGLTFWISNHLHATRLDRAASEAEEKMNTPTGHGHF